MWPYPYGDMDLVYLCCIFKVPFQTKVSFRIYQSNLNPSYILFLLSEFLFSRKLKHEFKKV